MRLSTTLTVLVCTLALVGPSIGAEDAAPEDEGSPQAVAAKAPPPLVVDENVPDVPNEDSLTKLERLDALSMQTHRQLSVARTQGQPKDTIEKLEKKIEKINEQRVATMKKLRIAH